MRGQGRDRGDDGVSNGFGAMTGERRTVLQSWALAVARHGGRRRSIVKRVVRSTRVPIAERFSPRVRSPSQWPGTARSVASAGRSLIITFGVTKGFSRPAFRGAGNAQRTPGAQAGGQFPTQRRRDLEYKAPSRSLYGSSALSRPRESRVVVCARSARGSTPGPIVWVSAGHVGALSRLHKGLQSRHRPTA